MSASSYKSQKLSSKILTNAVLIVICILWSVPTIGVLITSFRESQDIFRSGWWTVFPHKADVSIGEIVLDDSVDVNGPITLEGVTATFEEWRQGITLEDGRTVQWYGNKRTRKLTVTQKEWVGFSTNLTIQNYINVIGGKTITFKDGAGNTITRQGNNLGEAFFEFPGGLHSRYDHPYLDCCLRGFWVFLAEFSGAEYPFYHHRGIDGGSAAVCSGADSSGFCKFGIEWNLPRDLAGTHRFWSSLGHLPVI